MCQRLKEVMGSNGKLLTKISCCCCGVVVLLLAVVVVVVLQLTIILYLHPHFLTMKLG